MTTDPDVLGPLVNLEATYRAVGTSGTQGVEQRFEGGFLCVSDLPHAIGNFAVVREVGAERVRAIAECARGRKAFNAYLLPGPEQSKVAGLFERSGFRDLGRLQVMRGPSFRDVPLPTDQHGQAPLFPPSSARALDLEEAVTFERRLEIGRFMAHQFFGRQTSAVREHIALATTRSPASLYGVFGSKLIGAAMVMRTDGFLGIYSLCVEASVRERGYGSQVLGRLGEMARFEGRTPTLQCDPSVEPWYEKRGFGFQGTILVMGLED